MLMHSYFMFDEFKKKKRKKNKTVIVACVNMCVSYMRNLLISTF